MQRSIVEFVKDLVRPAKYVAETQFENLQKLRRGHPVVTPSFAGMTLDRDDIEIAYDWLKRENQWLVETPIQEFEQAFAEWNGVGWAYSFMAGRIGLSACLHALDLPPQSDVLVPGYTCVVVPNAVEFAGLNCVYCDIELETYGPCLESIEQKLTPNTSAIILHHLFGLVCRDYLEIVNLAKRRGIRLIEDCAHSMGATFQGKSVGSLGDVAFYSCEHSKSLSTFQGGIASTNDAELAKRLEQYQSSCIFPDPTNIRSLLYNVILDYYELKHDGRWYLGDFFRWRYGKNRLISTTNTEMERRKPSQYARRMPAPLAAIGKNQLNKLDGYNELRRNNAQRWMDWCEQTGKQKPTVIADSTPTFLRFPVMVEPARKSNTTWALDELSVKLGVWFVSNLHPVKHEPFDLPNAQRAVEGCVNLPTIF